MGDGGFVREKLWVIEEMAKGFGKRWGLYEKEGSLR